MVQPDCKNVLFTLATLFISYPYLVLSLPQIFIIFIKVASEFGETTTQKINHRWILCQVFGMLEKTSQFNSKPFSFPNEFTALIDDTIQYLYEYISSKCPELCFGVYNIRQLSCHVHENFPKTSVINYHYKVPPVCAFICGQSTPSYREQKEYTGKAFELGKLRENNLGKNRFFFLVLLNIFAEIMKYNINE